MQPLPHDYHVAAIATPSGDVPLSSGGLPVLATAAPVEYDGPGDRWSPETLLIGAAVDCLLLTFRAVAQASKLPWLSARCRGDGRLERVDGVTRFTTIELHVDLDLPLGTDTDKAARLLDKAFRACLITNSLSAQPSLTHRITQRT